MPKMKQLADASDEYFGAEIEVLADAKKDIPPSSSAGAPEAHCRLGPPLVSLLVHRVEQCIRNRWVRWSSARPVHCVPPASVRPACCQLRSVTSWHPLWSRSPFCARAGLALKQLTDAEGRPHYGGKGQGGRSVKGKWLSEKVKETMTSISMNEDLYDSDDEDAPPLPADLRRQVATCNNYAGSHSDPTTHALVKSSPIASPK